MDNANIIKYGKKGKKGNMTLSQATRQDGKKLTTFIDYCPKCGGELQGYCQLPGLPSSKSYCPSCDILRMHRAFTPYLCKNCNSTSFYNQDREKESVIHGLMMEAYDKLYSVEWEKRGEEKVPYAADNKKLTGDERERLRKAVAELGKQMPKDVCWFCGSTEFSAPTVEEFNKMQSEQALKTGYRISQIYGEIAHACGEGKCIPSQSLEKVAASVYSISCEKCREREYVMVPKWQQEEILELKTKRGEGGSVSTIRIEHLAMSQKSRVVTYGSQKDLVDHIEEALGEFLDEKREN